MAEQPELEAPAPEVLTEAKEIGWVPLEEFRGDKSKWIDAQTFLARGRDVMPLLRKNNERLRGELRQSNGKIQDLEARLAAGEESVAELLTFHKENLEATKKAARAQLLSEIKTARESGDPDAEIAAIGDLSKFDAEEAAAPAAEASTSKPKPATTPAAPKVEPWFEEWLSRNPEAKKQNRLTRMANVIAGEMRADPEFADLKGAEFLDEVWKRAQVEVGGGGDGGGPVDRVEAAGHTNHSSNGKRTFDSLPADAKAVARRQTPKMVGPGRAFKDEKSWLAYYTENLPE